MRCFLVNLVSFCPTFYIRDVKQPGLFLKAQGFGVQEIYSSRFENVENVNFEEEKPITWRCDVVRISEVSQPKLPLIKTWRTQNIFWRNYQPVKHEAWFLSFGDQFLHITPSATSGVPSSCYFNLFSDQMVLLHGFKDVCINVFLYLGKFPFWYYILQENQKKNGKTHSNVPSQLMDQKPRWLSLAMWRNPCWSKVCFGAVGERGVK